MLSSHLRRSSVGPWSIHARPGAAASPLAARERRHFEVLPYLGGGFVRSPSRRYRVLGRPTPGWYRFSLEGPEAIALEPSSPEGLERLAPVRGYLVGPWLFTGQGRAVRLHLMPIEQFLELSPCLGRRLPGGALLFDTLDLETEAETQTREALDEGLPCPSPTPALRAAYGFALLWRLCRRLGIPATPWGLSDQLARVAAAGKAGAFELLAPCASMAPLYGLDEAPPGADDEAVVGPALRAAGASLLGSRRLGDDLLEVRFRFLDRGFVCVVERSSLRVLDAGMCVDGSDGKLTLACLPAVLREAIASGRLVVTRRGA